MPRELFDQLTREAKSRAFTVARQASVRVLSDIHAAMLAGVEQGETLHDFRRRLPELMEERGWTGAKPWHADLVFRQQSMMSYTAGRFRQMQDVGITHWRYSALADGRTRPEHAALDGKVFAMSDRRYYPPWEFNCRCIAEPVFDDELVRVSVALSADLVGQQFGSDEATGRPLRFSASGQNFAWDPAQFADVAPLDLDTVPAALRPAFAELLRSV